MTKQRPENAGAPAAVVENGYDAEGRVAWQDDELDRRTRFFYDDPAAGQTRIVAPDGDQTVHTYENGRRIESISAYGTADQTTTRFEYDPDTFAMTAMIDGNGHRTEYFWDGWANRTKVVDPLGRVVYEAGDFTAFDQPGWVEDGEDVRTTLTYDANGNVTSSSTPEVVGGSPTGQSRSVSYTYGDPAHPGDVTAMNDPRGQDWGFGYDSFGYQDTVTDPTGKTTTATWDPRGWTTSTVAPLGNEAGANLAEWTTDYTHNAHGDVKTVTNPEGDVVSYDYDAARRVTSATDGESKTTTTVYDPAGQRTAVQRHDGSSLVYRYWPDGSLKEREDAAGEIWSYTYDHAGRLNTETDPLGRTRSYAYDDAGKQTQALAPGGACGGGNPQGCVTRAYNDANELVGIDYAAPGTPDVGGFSYDDTGRRTAMTDGTGTQSWSWDSFGQLRSHTDGAGATTSYAYDLAGARTEVTYPDGFTVTETPDALGRLDSLSVPGEGSFGFGWDANSNLDARTMPGGANHRVDYTQDRADRLTGMQVSTGGSTVLSQDWARDANDLVDDVTRAGVPGGDVEYGYDGLNQLTDVGAEAYGYDQADNLSERLDGTVRCSTRPTRCA